MTIKAFDYLKAIFNQHGFHLYVVGGTVRDYLLGLPLTDLDFVTDATPEDEEKFIPNDLLIENSEKKSQKSLNSNSTFKKYGAIRYPFEGKHIDITTLRQEGQYNDSRHPSSVKFVKDPKLDYVRRDFTVNALYLDEEYNVLDFVGGQEDIKKKIIRFIGDPEKRIEEDPLRICRAERFASVLGFEIEEETKKSLTKMRYLLEKMNPDKLKEEQRKGWKGTL